MKSGRRRSTYVVLFKVDGGQTDVNGVRLVLRQLVEEENALVFLFGSHEVSRQIAHMGPQNPGLVVLKSRSEPSSFVF